MSSQCLISFGSNLGRRDERIAEAAREIADTPQVGRFRTSRLFETPPIGGPAGQEPFLNAVGAFETTASARQILALLQQTEERLGRERRRRWDSRSIDLDVVLHGELVGGGTGLIVPHPRYTARQFVLKPACDVAGFYRDPRFDWSLERLSRHLDQGIPSMSLVAGDGRIRAELCQRLREQHGIQTFAARRFSPATTIVGNAPAAIRRDSSPPAAPQQVPLTNREPWVAEFLPPLPEAGSAAGDQDQWPRLIARIQKTTAQTRWPAPHQMWPSGWQWPEYRLEVDNLEWAASEIASAMTSMRCPVRPVTDDGDWWR